MAIGDPYAELDALKARVRATGDTNDDTLLTAALAAASLGVEKHCRRQFNVDASATARVFQPLTAAKAIVDDISSMTGLVIETDANLDGAFETTWDAADYQLEPLNGVRSGVAGWPYWQIRTVGGQDFYPHRRATLRVTARWGWASVPAPVQEATLVLAEELWKLRDSPFGVAGVGEFGVVRVRENPKVALMLAPYRRNAVLVG